MTAMLSFGITLYNMKAVNWTALYVDCIVTASYMHVCMDTFTLLRLAAMLKFRYHYHPVRKF